MRLIYRCATVTYRQGISCLGEGTAVATKRRKFDPRTHEYLVDRATGCWLWQRAKTTAGYGTLTVDGKTAYAHCIYYENYVGRIPPGLSLDHLCRNPACCNPAHLEPVTHAGNMRRKRRPRCQRGHAMTGDNLYVAPGGTRQCRECRRERARESVRMLGIAYKDKPPGRNTIAVQGPSLALPSMPSIPLGKCQCGCGADTNIARKTVSAKGVIKGRPMRYLRGHANSWRETGGYAIDSLTGCWIWQRSTSLQGYGQVWYNGKLHRAHRVFYELHRGSIPKGLQIDHKCGNRLCVNPDHLEPVTAIENTSRAMRRGK